MTQFIAEVCSNHNQRLTRCLKMVETAKSIGCDAVKFQLFRIDDLFAPEVIRQSPRHADRRAWELSLDYIPEIAAYCRELDLAFGCTPFYLQAVETAQPYVDFFKISSYEILWLDLLRACAQTGLPVVLSTGMADMHEICKAVETLQLNGCRQLTLLHCISHYPTPPAQCDLAFIATLRNRFALPVGWSDHSAEPAVIYRAASTWRAHMIEFHLDLDGHGAEYDQGHCWLPQAIGQCIETLQLGQQSDGHAIKRMSEQERQERQWRADPSDGLRPLLDVRLRRYQGG